MSNSDWLDNAFNANMSPTSDGHGPVRILKGGAGSGNFGHSGRPGQRGGSAPKGIPPFGAAKIGSTVTSVTGSRGTLKYDRHEDFTALYGGSRLQEAGERSSGWEITNVHDYDVQTEPPRPSPGMNPRVGDVMISYYVSKAGEPFIREQVDAESYSRQRDIGIGWDQLPDYIDRGRVREWTGHG